MKSEELAAPGSHRKLRTIEMNRISVEEFREAEKLPLIVVLDDVRSMYNIGSVFRTCDAFRVEAIYLCGITACPPHQEIHKTALGAEDSVAWRYFETVSLGVISKPLNRPWNSFIRTVISYGAWNSVKEV